MKCDFCGDYHVIVHYESKDFTIHLLTEQESGSMRSEGGWMACKQCAELIDGEKKDDLAKRSTEAIIKSGEADGMTPDDIYQAIRIFHEGFWGGYEGKYYPAVFHYARGVN